MIDGAVTIGTPTFPISWHIYRMGKSEAQDKESITINPEKSIMMSHKVFNRRTILWVSLGGLCVFTLFFRMALEHFVWQPERDRVKNLSYDDVIEETTRDQETALYLLRAVHLERKKKYKEALENYRECYELLPGDFDRGIVYGRVHYFLGNKLKSAKIYAYFLSHYASRKDISHFRDREKIQFSTYREEYKNIEHYVLSNPWELQQPFSTLDELIRFLVRFQREIPYSCYDGNFEDAITCLRELRKWHKEHKKEYEQWLKENCPK